MVWLALVCLALAIVTVVATIGAYVEVTAATALLCNAVTCSAQVPLVFALPVPAMTALAGAFIWVRKLTKS